MLMTDALKKRILNASKKELYDFHTFVLDVWINKTNKVN